jgi:hypothetical protein
MRLRAGAAEVLGPGRRRGGRLPHAVVLQDQRALAHLADKLEELGVADFGVLAGGQHVRQPPGLLQGVAAAGARAARGSARVRRRAELVGPARGGGRGGAAAALARRRKVLRPPAALRRRCAAAQAEVLELLGPAAAGAGGGGGHGRARGVVLRGGAAVDSVPPRLPRVAARGQRGGVDAEGVEQAVHLGVRKGGAAVGKHLARQDGAAVADAALVAQAERARRGQEGHAGRQGAPAAEEGLQEGAHRGARALAGRGRRQRARAAGGAVDALEILEGELLAGGEVLFLLMLLRAQPS